MSVCFSGGTTIESANPMANMAPKPYKRCVRLRLKAPHVYSLIKIIGGGDGGYFFELAVGITRAKEVEVSKTGHFSKKRERMSGCRNFNRYIITAIERFRGSLRVIIGSIKRRDASKP